ncbi:MAG: DUF4239 domain-containing protein [Candidatus Obscuribacterales bacterium]|nr:DUF4239 domain-containing protein [Candidatus Obscuribacterales bacterium]
MTFTVLIITGLVVLTVCGQVVVQRWVKHDFEPHQGVVEAMLGVVGTLFSVLLGLLVANSIDSYHDVKTQVSAEANSLGDVFRIARGFEKEDRVRVRVLCRQYADSVMKEEWPAMQNGHMSDITWDVYQQLWEAAVAVNPVNDREVNLHQGMVQAMQQFGQARRSRGMACTVHLQLAIWIAITAGAIITVLFTYFFAAKLGKLHTVMTALIAISLGLNIWLLAAYSSPFSGELQIQPDAFALLKLKMFNNPDTPSRFLHDTPVAQPVVK